MVLTTWHVISASAEEWYVFENRNTVTQLRLTLSGCLLTDLNPVWEETCFYLVTPEDLKAHEELLLVGFSFRSVPDAFILTP